MLVLLSAFLGCSSTPDVAARCSSDETVFADGLTCGRAKAPSRYLRVLAGRPLPAGSTAAALGTVAGKGPADRNAWLDDLSERGRTLEAAHGLEAMELRSTEIARLLAGQGPITEANADLWNLVPQAVSIRARDDQEGLVLTELDIEGWIYFASLAHEIRGGGPLTVSIADKGAIYDVAVKRFQQADRAEQVALVGLGAVWTQVIDAWKAAPYEQQQRFIQRARLPEAGATPAAWIEAVLEGDVVTNAHALHEVLGPFTLRDGDGYFGSAP